MSTEPLRYPLGAPPEVGTLFGVAPGVTGVRLPVPGSLRHINVWLLDDGPGVTLVDTGMDVAAARAVWEGPVSAALAGRAITRIVCTHHHPDHAGLAAWLALRHGVAVHMSAAEARLMHTVLAPGADARRLAGFAADGFVPTGREAALLGGGGYRSVISGAPADLRPLAGGGRLTTGRIDWELLEVAGHTDGQILLYAPAERLLIAGDQLLPRISSNIGVYPERVDPDPIASYLGSFRVLGALPAQCLVLPSHGEPFVGIATRIAALEAHHARTLDQVVALVTAPVTAAEVAPLLFRGPHDALNSMLAFGETLAHLHHLGRQGRLGTIESADGPRRFAPL